MKYHSEMLEKEAVMETARKMCAAARTAPKTRGIDYIETCLITGKEKDALAEEMERLSTELDYPFFVRDAKNIRASEAVVLIGTTYQQRNLNEGCRYCNRDNCAQCAKEKSVCAYYDNIDLGIAVGSAVSVAADNRVDNRVMFSAGRAALSLNMMAEDTKVILAIPLSVSSKSPYFDRK